MVPEREQSSNTPKAEPDYLADIEALLPDDFDIPALFDELAEIEAQLKPHALELEELGL